MIQTKPVSELRNNFPAIEKVVNEGNPVFLTKNGYVSMVLLSLETFASLTSNIELKLDEADKAAALSDRRLSHTDVFGKYNRSAQ